MLTLGFSTQIFLFLKIEKTRSFHWSQKLFELENFPRIKSYTVEKLNHILEVNGDWNKAPWKDIRSLEVKEWMGFEPKHKPKVSAKLTYDKGAVYVIFRVEDRYVKCLRTSYQDEVYKDSAVEFFFSPSNDTSLGYFNLEINCGGTALYKFRSEERGTVLIPKSLFDEIEIAHSLPKIVNPEIESEVIWTIEMRIPLNILEKFYPLTKPASEVKWRANFYKIADDSSHPHYLTWAKVEHPKPNFHLPEFFGTLIFN